MRRTVWVAVVLSSICLLGARDSRACTVALDSWSWFEARAVATNGDAVFAARPPGVQILTMEPWGALAPVGELEIPARVTSVAASENRVAVGSSDELIRLFGIVHPDAGVEFGTLEVPSAAMHAALDDRHLAVASDAMLLVWDIANPASPELLDTVDLGHSITALELAANLVAVGTTQELCVYELTDDGLAMAASTATSGPNRDLVTDGRWLYVAGAGVLRTYDLASEPGLAESARWTSNQVVSDQLTLHDQGLAVGEFGSSTGSAPSIWLFDRTDPSQPEFLDSTSLPHSRGDDFELESLADTLILGWSGGWIETWDLGLGTDAVHGTLDEPKRWRSTGLAREGQTAITSVILTEGSVMPRTVVFQSTGDRRLRSQGWVPGVGEALDVALRGTMASVRWEVLAADGWDDSGLSVIDLADPLMPLEKLRIDGLRGRGGVAMIGPWILLGDHGVPGESGGRLLVVDPDAPADEAIVTEYSGLDGPAHAIAGCGQAVIVADQASEIRVFDATALPSLAETAVHPVPGWPVDLAASGDLVLAGISGAGFEGGGLAVIRLEGWIPRQMAWMEASRLQLGSVSKVALEGTTAVAFGCGTDGGSEAVVVDLSAPQHPVVLGRRALEDSSCFGHPFNVGIAVAGSEVLMTGAQGLPGILMWDHSGCQRTTPEAHVPADH